MKKAINHWAFPQDWSLPKCFKVAKDAGFHGIEVNIAEEGEITLNSTSPKIKKIVDEADKIGIKICSLSTGLFWKYPITSPDKKIRDKAKDIIKKMLETAFSLKVDGILVVPGLVTEKVSYEAAYKI